MSSTTTSPTVSQALDPHLQNITNIAFSKFFVYKAHDTNSHADIVLKAFPPRTTSQAYFNREKFILSHLSHPHIIKYLRSITHFPLIPTHPDDSYICLEFAEYGDLYEIVSRRGPMSERLARTLFKQLLEGLSYLHSKNISHLDLKLENILLDHDFQVKIIDFDLAQPLHGDKLLGKGTAGYRAPEVKDGSCNVFGPADIYSLGIILFIMVSGMPPYTEIQNNTDYSWDKFYLAMRYRNDKFWQAHSTPKGNSDFYCPEFKDLFNGMVAEFPDERPTIKELEEHPWMMNGETLDDASLVVEMRSYLGINDEIGAVSLP
jgi:serine/threonine protein kinase